MSRILIVEDNPLNLKLASVILRAEGHEIVGAANADEAERMLDGGRPDLVLMDLGLPGKDGYAYAQELRNRDSTRSVPIVAVTSYAMVGDRRKAHEAGCVAYITKPIDRAALVRTVRELLGPEARASRRDAV
jgi:CheY-like chemotaxis protein